MQSSRAYRSRRSVEQRLAAGTLALVTLVGLGGCRASGGGYIDEPLPGGSVSDFEGRAHFAFNFSCEDEAGDPPRIEGNLTYSDAPSVVGGGYDGYTRAGYLDGGNIQSSKATPS